MVYRVSHETDPTSFSGCHLRTGIEELIEAIQSDVSSLEENQTSQPCCLPPGRKEISIKWDFKKKSNAEGKVCRYKARLVWKGFMEKEGIDCVETFAPVAKFESITCLIAIATYYSVKLEQMDVVTVFFNPSVREEIYIQFPQGLEAPEEFQRGAPAIRLLKGLYGLKQAPRLYNDAVNDTLHRLNFTRCNSDPCLYVRKQTVSFLSSLFILMILS